MHVRNKNTWTTKNLIKTIVVLILATFAAILTSYFTTNNIAVTYLLAVVIISKITDGYQWGLFASLAGVIGVNYFFTFPYLALDFTRNGYPIMFFVMFITSIIIGTMTARIKDQARQSEIKEANTQALYKLSKALLATRGIDKIIPLALEHIKSFLNTSVIYHDVIPDADHKGYSLCINKDHEEYFHTPKEYERVHKIFESKHRSGMSSIGDDKYHCIYLPLISHEQLYGVIGILSENDVRTIKNNETYIDLMISQTAMALERQRLSDEQRTIIVETEKEKMRSNLLRAVSHDLRTPLTGIIGASATILENEDLLDQAAKREFIAQIHEDSQWLIHMVENLLSVTRIKEDGANVVKMLEAGEEIIAEACSRIKKKYPDTKINVKVPDELLMIPMDATLIEQLIINLVENAILHSGSPTPIDIALIKSDKESIFTIRDYGHGLISENSDKLFTGPYTQQNNESRKGMGIGLSICLSIIKAHGGTLIGKNVKDEVGGAIFTFTLPLEEIYES